MSQSNFDDVVEFHHKFNLNPNDVTPEQYQQLLDFRKRFLEEELDEFIKGLEEEDDAQMFDALLDLVYVAMGTAYLLGYPWEDGWDAVQAANMAKVRADSASNSKRGSAWDVVKPDGWTAPDIGKVLRNVGFDA